MIAVGIDPSLRKTGLARIEGTAVTTSIIRTVPASGLAAQDDQIVYILGTVVKFVPRGSLVVIERMYVPRGAHTAGDVIERAWLLGMIVNQLRRRGCEVVGVWPMQRAKLATGSGTAKKKDVLAAMREKFPGVSIPDDNVADAVALAAAGARWLGVPIDGAMTDKQADAMAAVAWPTTEMREK
jgi:Holliday junction resolvasome RuvABC endonuclease subunit